MTDSQERLVFPPSALFEFHIFQGSVLTSLGILGVILNSAILYLFIRRRIKLANHQGRFIINLAVSDLIVSAIGVPRGLGIMDSKFVGAPDGTATTSCAAYAISAYSFGFSGMFALLPLTIDRAVAVVLPLRHSSIVTKRTCLVMFLAAWLPILSVLVEKILRHEFGAISVEYSVGYHRCALLDNYLFFQYIFLFFVPFFSVLLTYAMIFLIIIKTKRSFGKFLVLSFVIIATNLIAYTPSAIIDMAEGIQMSYEVFQVMYITLWYINGVTNPLIYVVAHPKTREYLRSCWQKDDGPHSGIKLDVKEREGRIPPEILSNNHADIIYSPPNS